jgi:hypothetical protein
VTIGLAARSDFEVSKLFRKLVIPWRFTSKRGRYLGIVCNSKQTTQMRNNIIISILTLLLFACNSNTNKKSSEVETADSSTIFLTNIKSERFFPETKATEKFDTLIADKQFQITIIRTDLDSYVINEYEDNGKKQIDKYRDAEIALTIKQKTQTLLDTVFRKEQFSKYGEKGFMDIAIFHNYWFNKLNNDKIELFGVISKPETDWTIDFHHYFDLKNRKLNFKQEINEEEKQRTSNN